MSGRTRSRRDGEENDRNPQGRWGGEDVHDPRGRGRYDDDPPDSDWPEKRSSTRDDGRGYLQFQSDGRDRGGADGGRRERRRSSRPRERDYDDDDHWADSRGGGRRDRARRRDDEYDDRDDGYGREDGDAEYRGGRDDRGRGRRGRRREWSRSPSPGRIRSRSRSRSGERGYRGRRDGDSDYDDGGHGRRERRGQRRRERRGRRARSPSRSPSRSRSPGDSHSQRRGGSRDPDPDHRGADWSRQSSRSRSPAAGPEPAAPSNKQPHPMQPRDRPPSRPTNVDRRGDEEPEGGLRLRESDLEPETRGGVAGGGSGVGDGSRAKPVLHLATAADYPEDSRSPVQSPRGGSQQETTSGARVPSGTPERTRDGRRASTRRSVVRTLEISAEDHDGAMSNFPAAVSDRSRSPNYHANGKGAEQGFGVGDSEEATEQITPSRADPPEHTSRRGSERGQDSHQRQDRDRYSVSGGRRAPAADSLAPRRKSILTSPAPSGLDARHLAPQRKRDSTAMHLGPEDMDPAEEENRAQRRGGHRGEEDADGDSDDGNGADSGAKQPEEYVDGGGYRRGGRSGGGGSGNGGGRRSSAAAREIHVDSDEEDVDGDVRGHTSWISPTMIAYEHGERTPLVQCYILRNRKGGQKLHPQYDMYFQHNNKHILTAKKQSGNRTSNYHIFDVSRGTAGQNLSKKSGNYAGKLRSKFLKRTGYVFYTADKNRGELGAVLFDRPSFINQVRDGSQPRKLMVLVPLPDEDRLPCPHDEADGSSLLDLLAANQESAGRNFYMESKAPVFENGNYRLNFGGRVTVPSVKNFQLVNPEDIDHIFCQFGKVGDDRFHIDFRAPLSAFQAFCVALSQFNL